MRQSDSIALFTALQKATPNPQSALRCTTPFECLVAVVLSAQTTDKSVNHVTQHLFSVADTPEKIIALGEATIRNHLRSLGLYNTKAKRLYALSKQILEYHQGLVPRDPEALRSLPGVGRKTANVILNLVFGEPRLAVDTHVFRVANRTGLARGATPEEVERNLLKTTPKPFLHKAHLWLLLHGRDVCKARRPLCDNCVIQRWCDHWREHS